MVKPGPIKTRVQVGNLWIMPLDHLGRSTGIILLQFRCALRIGELRKEFDYRFDRRASSQLLWGGGSAWQMADGVILVVEANSTRRNGVLAKEALKALRLGSSGVLKIAPSNS